MLYLASTSSDLDALGAHPQIGVMTGPRVGGLGSIPHGRPWASDCDALSKYGYDDEAFFTHLDRLVAYRQTCLFIVIPDVPGDGESTLANYLAYAPLLAPLGCPLAYVAQDGAHALELPPCDVVFLGGTDPYREAYGALVLEQAAQAGHRTHVGRVNSQRRLVHLAACPCDSADGTYVGFRGVSRGLKEVGGWLGAATSPRLIAPHDTSALPLTEGRVQAMRDARTARPRRHPDLGHAGGDHPTLF
jgi:hypothetical protein